MSAEFRKEEFMDYIHDNFSFDISTLRLIERIVDYGLERCNKEKDQFFYFVTDLLDGLGIDQEEVAMFCPREWLTDDVIILTNEYKLEHHIPQVAN